MPPCVTAKVKTTMNEPRPWRILEHDLETVAREERRVAEYHERVLRAGRALDQAQAAYDKAVKEQNVANQNLAMLLHRSLFFGVWECDVMVPEDTQRPEEGEREARE